MALPLDEDESERDRTNESLEGERRKTDEELERRTATLAENADEVVTRARGRADEVLVAARLAADEKLRGAGAGRQEHAALADERHQEDEVLREERSTADQELDAEREARRDALIALLALEREETDYHLGFERERADESIQKRDDFLGIVSHDIRNMLGGIALSAAVLLEADSRPEAKKTIPREAKRIQRYTARMSRLVGDLLDIVSIEAARLAVVPKPHDARELLCETVDAFRPIAATKNIELRTEVGDGSLVAEYDHDRLLQVLSNLVGNAIKFTRQGGSIELTVRSVEQGIRFAVADTGPGLAPDKLELIFERFWQSSKRDSSGLGLGLYIARSIVEAHGGRIWAESQLGQGTTFNFTLPVTSTPETAPAL